MSKNLVSSSEIEPITVSTVEDLDKIKNNQIIIFKCRNCGKYQKYKFRKHRIDSISMFLCTNCKKEKTTFSHYGVKNPGQSEEVKNKMKETCLQRYGVEYAGSSEVHKQKVSDKFANKTLKEKEDITKKVKQTKKERYGDENYNNQEKLRKTNKERYGTEIASQSKEIKDKTKQYFLNKFGCENPGQNSEIKEKIKNTFQSKYGVDYWIASEEGKIKVNDAIIKKYKTRFVHAARYKFNNIIFDSSWELCFYIYHIDHNNDIKRVNEPFLYTYNGETHRYYPDFIVNGVFYEIKGSHFWKKDGTMQNPYDHRKDALFEAKHLCGIVNNVVFIKQKEIKPYIEYVINTYGKDFISSCIRSPK